MWLQTLGEWLGLIIAVGGALEALRRIARWLWRLRRSLLELASAVRAAGEAARAINDFAHLFLGRLGRLEELAADHSQKLADLAEIVTDHDADLARLTKG